MKNKRRFPIEMEKIREMYKFPLWRSKEKEVEKKEIWPRRRSIIWRIVAFAFCIWGGYELAILWHINFPENFPVKLRWLVAVGGCLIGAAIGLLFANLFMSRRRGK